MKEKIESLWKEDWEFAEYEDMLFLPHHVSRCHPPMSMEERAAQFSPFAALTGYEDAIRETGRTTVSRAELDEGVMESLDEKLRQLKQKRFSAQAVTVTCFVPDEKKKGGKYMKISGRIRRMDEYRRVLIMEDGKEIPMESVAEIEECNGEWE